MTAFETVGHSLSSVVDMSIYSDPTPDADGKFFTVGTFHANTPQNIASALTENGHVFFSIGGGYVQYFPGAFELDGQPLVIDLSGSQSEMDGVNNRGITGDVTAAISDVVPNSVKEVWDNSVGWFQNLEGMAKKGVIAALIGVGLFLLYKIVKIFK